MKIPLQPDSISHSELVLFPFDDYAFPFQEGLDMHLVQFTHNYAVNLGNTVLKLGAAGAPDSRGISYYGTVCRVDGEYWMWYLGRSDDTEWHQRVCLALSSDGVRWRRPDLGLVDYKGDRHNNLVALSEGRHHIQACVVFHEPSDPDPERRFKMAFETTAYRKKLAVAFSADGKKWVESARNPVGRTSLEMSGGTRIGNAYFLNGQGGIHPAAGKRSLVTYVSHDFENWSAASCLGFRRRLQPRHPAPSEKNVGEHVHLGAALWNRGNVILGFYGQWHGHSSNDRMRGVIDLGLVVTHDGLHYREPIPDFPMVSAAEVGRMPPHHNDFVLRTAGLIQGQGFENIGDETFFWYAQWPEHQSNGVRLARWERDRLGFLNPVHAPHAKRKADPPHAVSSTVHLEGETVRLWVNADGLNENCRLRVGILDEAFQPLADYSGDQCVEIAESGLRLPVAWKTREAVDGENGNIRVRIDFTGLRFEDARLFAIYLEPVNPVSTDH